MIKNASMNYSADILGITQFGPLLQGCIHGATQLRYEWHIREHKCYVLSLKIMDKIRDLYLQS